MTTRATGIAGTLAKASDLLVRPLLFVGGKGGVGKTTVAAGIALAVAERWPARKVLLLSTDPAHSLRDALGGWQGQLAGWQGQLAGSQSGKPAMPGPNGGAMRRANLDVVELDATQVFAGFRARHREGLRKIALRGTFLDEADLARFLDLGFPGLDELAGLEVVAEILKAGAVDHIVVDTAPTGHTLRLLAMPAAIEAWKGALDVLMNKHRVMARLYAGSYRKDEADALIAALEEIVAGVRHALGDPRSTAFVPVMNADALSLHETRRLLAALTELGVSAPCVVVNRLGRERGRCARCARRMADETAWVDIARREFRPALIEVPWLDLEPANPEKLSDVGRFLLGWGPDPSEDAAAGPTRPLAAPAARIAPPKVFGTASVFFACGKGGVGKTTVACALALWLRRRARGPTLLFSTDPAHSVSDALEVKIGETPTRVVEGLDAVQINPDDCMDRLRTVYRREIGAFFESLFQSELLKDSLDREAMESLIELSPPGMDEIMALVELARHFREGRYARYVVDTAPTGHFLRLMEMPEVMRGWIRALFEILLKYNRLFRGAGLQEYLVELSKGLRALQEILRDRERTVLVPVMIPGALSLEETRDLLRSTDRMGLAVGAGVLNHIVRRPDGEANWPSRCRVCERQASVSYDFIERYRKAFDGLPLLHLEEQVEAPVGVRRLDAIGSELFGPWEGKA